MTKNFSNFSIKLLITSMFCLFLGIGQIFAQSTVTGGIRGTVTDPRKAIVPNATITATNIGTNSTETVTSDGNGTFVINNLIEKFEKFLVINFLTSLIFLKI
jgi:hypothetical protein